jgi:hypothetical protein
MRKNTVKTFALSDDDIEFLHWLGSDNASRGLRFLIKKFKSIRTKRELNQLRKELSESE